MREIILAIIFFILGLIFGSFINAWVWRTENDLSVAKGRSICPKCKHKLAWYDLMPVLSYTFIRGKCHYCKAKISLQYPVVELATGLLFVAQYLLFRPAEANQWVSLIIYLILSVLLVSAFLYDAKHMELPEKYTLPAVALGLLNIGLIIYWRGIDSVSSQLVYMAVFLLAYIGLWYFSKGKWLGAGDIRLAAIMGLFLAPKQLLVGVFAAYLIGSIYGVYVMSRSKNKRGIKVPFGPFLIIGFYIGLFFGQVIADWYLKLLT